MEKIYNPLAGDKYPKKLKGIKMTNETATLTDQEKMVDTIQQVLAILAENYPEDFRTDGYTLKSTQVMGMFQQMLVPTTGMPGMPNN